jgi:hypothetical protein
VVPEREERGMGSRVYDIYAIDPKGDDRLLQSVFNLDHAKRVRLLWATKYAGSGCRIEIWQDGEKVED